MKLPAILSLAAMPIFAASPDGRDIKPDKELLITHPAVVDSEFARYPGPWSFGALMTELSGGEKGAEFVRGWLESFSTPQVVGADRGVGGIKAAHRGKFHELVIEPWQRRDGYDPYSCEEWMPKLENAPFRLLAIVNRMDLAAPSVVDAVEAERLKWRHFGKEEAFEKLLQGSQDGIPFRLQPRPLAFRQGVPSGGYGLTSGRSSPSGEGRLVFGAVDSAGKPLAGGWTIIFEYELSAMPPGAKADEKASVAMQWAKLWHTLGDMDLTDQRFPAALADITRIFTHRAPVGAGPTLGQLRSNDGAFGPGREFRQYDVNCGVLRMVPLPGTPAPAFTEKSSREGRVLSAFLNEQTPLILAGIGNLPASVADRGKTLDLRAAVALIPAKEPRFHWDFAVPREVRRLVSMQTCNGCHAGETKCEGGMHIHPRDVGRAAMVSGFLSGVCWTGNDPAFKNSSVDLREMEDRKAIFAALLNPRESSQRNDLRDILRARLRRAH